MLGSAFTPAMFAALKAADGTVAVVAGGVTADGLVDVEGVEFPEDAPAVMGRTRAVIVPAGALPALVNGVSLTVGGVSYKARSVAPYGDGALIRVELTT